MKRQMMWFMATVLAVTVLSTMAAGQAQDASADRGSKPQPEFQFYRVNFTLKELEDGKVINTRNYQTSMRTVVAPRGVVVTTGDASAAVRTGIKVPVTTRNDQNVPTVTYMDVGVNIDCRLESAAPEAPASGLRVFMDISSLAPSGSVQGEVAGGNPIIRSIRGNATVPFVLDRPTLVTSVDDVTSKRQYQLEVTVTKK